MDTSNPKISVEYLNDTVVITLTDERILEDIDIKALEESLLPLVDQNSGSKFILDFSNVGFLSSSVLGLLIRTSKKIYEDNGELVLCCISKKIYEIFRITRLDKVFDIRKTLDEALDNDQ